MRYASVCSGVEAATLAWEYLGWKPVWFSEIDPFPCTILKERFPNVPNLGDMTKIKGENYHGTVDLLVGGTPCQGFSLAGKQEGLRDERSVLCLTYVELLKTMRPRWFVWENVPGVFSSGKGEDFKAFIRAIEKSGYSCAWRVLDAQYVRVDGYPRAIPQRRRRVFVVGHSSGKWEYPAEVLFEPQIFSRDIAPCRKKWKETAPTAGRSVEKTSGDGKERTIICRANDHINAEYVYDVGTTLKAQMMKCPPIILNDQGGKVMAIEHGGNAATLRANTHGNEQIVCLNTVRRFTPIECERLMGFPDNWTRIQWKGKPEKDCPDGPRYKACGNSMCVNVMRWIDMRIENVERKIR